MTITPPNRTTGGVFIYNTMKGGHFHPASLRTGFFHATKQMADDKKNIPDVASPTEAPAPTVEAAAMPEQLAPEPVLTDAEAVMLEHDGHAALFEMGDAVPDPGEDNPTPAYSG